MIISWMVKNKRRALFYIFGTILFSTSAMAGIIKLNQYHHGGAWVSAATSRPNMNLYQIGEQVYVTVSVKHGDPNKMYQLDLKVLNAVGTLVYEKDDIPVSPESSVRMRLPLKKLGFYRVYVSASDGITIPRDGSRPSGFITFAITPDIASRKAYPESETFFGMQGGFNKNVQVMPYLGIRWVLGGLRWDQFNHATDKPQAYEYKEQYAGIPWKLYYLPALYFPPSYAVAPGMHGVLRKRYYSDWSAYCFNAAKENRIRHAELKNRYYQVTWEPNMKSMFNGSMDQLVNIYKIAYKQIHAGDPEAIVLGPTSTAGGSMNFSASLAWDRDALKHGLWRYIDGFSIHPYFSTSVSHGYLPRQLGLIDYITTLKTMLKSISGKEIAIYGTEMGMASNGTAFGELEQAQGLIQANLIALGEGFKFNIDFYIADYPREPGFGFFYNLNPKIAFGTNSISPKPVAAAFAAQTFLLNGYKAVGNRYLSSKLTAYTYSNGSNEILALWTEVSRRYVTIAVHAKSAWVYGWMGNGHKVKVDDGKIKIYASPRPTYIKLANGIEWSIL